MVFSSPEFMFLFFPISLLIYYITPRAYRNISLLILSLTFYGWGEPIYLILMILTIIINYVFGYLIGLSKNKGTNHSKLYLIIAIILNIGTLAFFKYSNFILSNINNLFGASIPLLNITLPIGISFYTFQALSYVIDVYRDTTEYQKSIINFGTYVSLYPQLIAGPIVKYSDINSELSEREHSLPLFASGVKTFTSGLAKKVLLANIAGEMWTTLSSSGTVLGSWIGLLFFMFQIYFDFSGYSDMAIGLGKMLGFHFKENFFYPYASTSISDFWRRWHISLGTFFREYVYIPLGGNKSGKLRTFINIFIVWLLTGLWHGASWNFVLWGLYYAVFLIVEKAFLGNLLDKCPIIIRRIYTLVIVFFGWWLFAFDDLSKGINFISIMFGNSSFSSSITTYEILRNVLFIVILIFACTPYPKKIYYKLYSKSKTFRYICPLIIISTLIICIAYMISSSYNPFLYFRF